MRYEKFLIISGMTLLFSVPSDGSRVIATVNKKPITMDYFNKKYIESQQFFSFQPITKKAVLEDLINREVGIQEAKKLGLHNDPEVIDQMNTILYQALLKKKLEAKIEKIHVSDEEAEAYFRKNPEIRTSHIFVRVAPGAKKEDEIAARKTIEKILAEQVKPGKLQFAEIARRFSEGAAAQMGGDVGYQTRATLDPAYYEAALALRSPGRVSGIVRSQFGFHIIKLTAIRTWKAADKKAIKDLVFEERRKRIYEAYMAQLRKKAKIQVNASLI